METNNKLREAVKCLMDNLNIHLMQPSELITVNRAELDGMVMVCEKALAAPPRNCDRFATIDEARKAHEAICEKYGKCHHGCPLNNEEHYSAFDCFEAWLFAQAEEGEK